MDDMNALQRQVTVELDELMGPARPVDDAAIFTAITATQSPKWRFQSMFSATKFVVAGAIVALFGGFLLAGVLTQPSEEAVPAVGASASAAPASPPPIDEAVGIPGEAGDRSMVEQGGSLLGRSGDHVDEQPRVVELPVVVQVPEGPAPVDRLLGAEVGSGARGGVLELQVAEVGHHQVRLGHPLLELPLGVHDVAAANEQVLPPVVVEVGGGTEDAPIQGAVYQALLSPGDTILAMNLDHGGHLTHGSPVNFSGKLYNVHHYGVRQDDHRIDFDQVASLAKEHKPKLIIAGGSAYPRQIDFKRFREIADSVGAYLMADIAHVAGLVVTGHYPSPVPYADVVTSTTHKTLRGPRGGLILAKAEYRDQLGKQIFPGTQGGPLMHVIAAKAVAFAEALRPDFKDYAAQVVANARAMADELVKAWRSRN